MKKLQAVIFDLDDTLHDKSETLRIVADKQFDQFNLSQLYINKTAWVKKYTDLNNLRIEKSEVFNRLQVIFKLPSQIMSSLLKDFDTTLGEFVQPFPGAINLVKSCKENGLKTAIVTNGRDAFQRSKISGLGIDAFIDVIITSGGFGIKKPDARIFQECLTALDVDAPHTVLVGDDLNADIEPASKMGMLPILKSDSQSELAAFCSDSLCDIQRFLFKTNIDIKKITL